MKESEMKHVVARKDFVKHDNKEESGEQLQKTTYSVHNVLTRDEFMKSDNKMEARIPKLERLAEVKLLDSIERVKNYDEYVKAR